MTAPLPLIVSRPTLVTVFFTLINCSDPDSLSAAGRKALQHQVLHIPEHPQLIIRIGWPATAAAELPPTPRRDLRSVLLPS